MQVGTYSSSLKRHYPVRENERPGENRERHLYAGSEDLQIEDNYSSSEERGYSAREKERLREREGSSTSPPRNRERHKEGNQAGLFHSISRQKTYGDFIGKCEVLEERKTSDASASSKLPEMSESSGEMGKNSGKNRKLNRPKQPGKSETDSGMNAEKPVEDNEGTVNWRRVQVLVMVLEHAGNVCVTTGANTVSAVVNKKRSSKKTNAIW